MATTKSDPNVEAVQEYQDQRTLDDPEVGPEDNIIVSPFSQQQLDERIEAGEGEAVRQELAEAAEGLKSQTHGGRLSDSSSAKSNKAKKDNE
jgi:hypothetical protein